MEDRTFTYLQGRFRDYYRSVDFDLPPDIDQREWGIIPWSQGGTRMVRHKSMLEIGDVNEFLEQEHPQHVYTSASRYEEPGAPTMEAKRWINSDLVFDIDIDESHLPESVESAEDMSHSDMLNLAKEHLLRLIDFLEVDFGFTEIDVVFSGGRGFHVHVRDDSIKSLDSQQRAEIVSYIRGVNHDLDAITRNKWTTVGVPKGKSAECIKPVGGWSSRVHQHIVDTMEETLRVVEECHNVTDEAEDRLEDQYTGVGPSNSEDIVDAFINHEYDIRAGHINVAPGVKSLARAVSEEVHEKQYAEIDEPVTTDINRLIRLPETLHGGTGMCVTPIPKDEIEEFEPLVDAVPETFTRQEISVVLPESTTVEMLGESYDLEAGEHRVPEAVGIYLMTRGNAEKGEE